jgi:TonB family protein
MALRCFLFSSDEGTADLIRQVLTGLGVEGETCAEADISAEKLAKESFQLVVIDWDQQPEASALLAAARERKAAERPLTLAIVSDDPSVPKALQAGANSILRRPLLLNQVKDTLTTARDLLRARVESAATAAQAAAAAAASAGAATTTSASIDSEFSIEKPLHPGEFLNAAPVASSGIIETDSEVVSLEQSVASEINPLKELEPVAAPAPVAPPPGPPRSLEELLRARGVNRQTAAPQPPRSADSGKPELLGFDQSPSHSAPQSPEAQEQQHTYQQKQEAQLFAYIDGEGEEPKKEAQPSRFRLSKGPIIAASILAGCAIVLAPQAPWHPAVHALVLREQRALHAWLNPQPVITPQAPATHEEFGRAGDEYKLPAAEAIPDATTDPSQIRVEPVVDPTAKKSASDSAAPDPNAASNPVQPAVQTDAPANAPADAAQTPAVQAPQSQPVQSAPVAIQPAAGSTSAPTVPATSPVATPTPAPAAQTSNTPAVVYTPVTTTAAPPKPQPTPYVPPTTKVPSSLQSQMATMVPDASGNKSPDAAMQAIEPVDVPELTERALLTDQPPLDLPASAGAQQGTVILQVLVGRDGAVQDAKFLQGSLAFARAAIDGVKQWKFKPYMMNGRPVSVATRMTIKFPPQ